MGTPLLISFTNLYWVDDLDDQTSTAGYVFTLGYRPITWDCKKQQALFLSLVEVEYQATVNVN